MPAPGRQTSLARHPERPLARHRMINLHVLLAAADRATREAVEAALELDPFFIVRGCVSGVEALALAVAWPPDLVPLEAPARAHRPAIAALRSIRFPPPVPSGERKPAEHAEPRPGSAAPPDLVGSAPTGWD